MATMQSRRAKMSVSDKLNYHRHLESIAKADIEYVRRKTSQTTRAPS